MPIEKSSKSKFRIIVLLLLGLTCIYASYAIPLYYGFNKRTGAIAMVLFLLIGAPLFLFFDFLLKERPDKPQLWDTVNIIYAGLGLMIGDSFLYTFWHISILGWLNMIMYSCYFAILCYRANKISR